MGEAEVTQMSPPLYSGIRSLVQIAISWLFAHFVILGQVTTPPEAIEWIMTAVVGALYVWLVNWLGTRKGDGQWPKTANLLAKVLMLGLAKTPSYALPEKKA
jgi:hypothetical protein